MATPGTPLCFDDPLLHWDDPQWHWDMLYPATQTMSNNPNRISAVLSDADKTAIMAAVATILTKLPFLQGLTPAERKKMPHASEDRLPFLDQATIAIAQHPEVLPSTFDPTEFAKDVALVKQLSSVNATLASLQERVLDTYTLASSEAYVAGLDVYRYFKAANKSGELDSYVDLLGQIFVRHTTPATPTPTPTPTP